MRKFSWSKKADYGKHGPIFYKSDKQPIFDSHNKQFAEATIETRVNGKNTAYAIVNLSVEWASNIQWGYTISRHFTDSSQAGNKARSWCNYFLNNPPYYIWTWSKHLEK
jgi:hypothetical protein